MTELDHCAQCGAPLREDQEFCLRCGSSRSLIYTPPDWRFPVTVVVVVIVIALAGFIFVLGRLSRGASHTAAADSAAVAGSSPATAAGTGPTSTTSTGTGTTSAKVSGIASWPVGLDGWTVVLEKDKTESAAYARAQKIQPTGTAVGVLNSSDHPSMKPGYWIVFSGRFPNRAQAQTAAAKLVSDGYQDAKARRVAKPGGL